MLGSRDPAFTSVPSAAGGWRCWDQALGTALDQSLSPCAQCPPFWDAPRGFAAPQSVGRSGKAGS